MDYSLPKLRFKMAHLAVALVMPECKGYIVDKNNNKKQIKRDII